MLWRVQTVWSGGIHTGFAGREEHLARRDVARLLETWTVVNLRKSTALFTAGKMMNFGFEAKMAADSILNYLAQDDVWSAYDNYHAFLDRWTELLQTPAWLYVGAVILEAPPGKGPKTRKRFLSADDFPEDRPLNPDDPSAPSLGSATLGVMRRWKVSSASIGGRVQSSIFVKEDEALARASYLLGLLATRLHAHASAEAVAAISEERLQYADDAVQVVFQITDLVKAGQPILALDRWKAFESRYEGLFKRPSLAELVGSVRIEVESPGSLGAPLRRWRIRVETPGEPIEESTHLVESEALSHVRRALEGIIGRALFQLEVFRDFLYRRNDDYLVNFQGALDFASDQLQRGAVQDALETWRGFQTYDALFAAEENLVGPPPVGPLVGTIVVETT